MNVEVIALCYLSRKDRYIDYGLLRMSDNMDSRNEAGSHAPASTTHTTHRLNRMPCVSRTLRGDRVRTSGRMWAAPARCTASLTCKTAKSRTEAHIPSALLEFPHHLVTDSPKYSIWSAHHTKHTEEPHQTITATLLGYDVIHTVCWTRHDIAVPQLILLVR